MHLLWEAFLSSKAECYYEILFNFYIEIFLFTSINVFILIDRRDFFGKIRNESIIKEQKCWKDDYQ